MVTQQMILNLILIPSSGCNQPDHETNDDVVQSGSNQLCDEPESNVIGLVKRSIEPVIVMVF